MPLDEKLKNYAKYQLDYERSNALRKAYYGWCSSRYRSDTTSHLLTGHMKQFSTKRIAK